MTANLYRISDDVEIDDALRAWLNAQEAAMQECGRKIFMQEANFWFQDGVVPYGEVFIGDEGDDRLCLIRTSSKSGQTFARIFEREMTQKYGQKSMEITKTDWMTATIEKYKGKLKNERSYHI